MKNLFLLPFLLCVTMVQGGPTAPQTDARNYAAEACERYFAAHPSFPKDDATTTKAIEGLADFYREISISDADRLAPVFLTIAYQRPPSEISSALSSLDFTLLSKEEVSFGLVILSSSSESSQDKSTAEPQRSTATGRGIPPKKHPMDERLLESYFLNVFLQNENAENSTVLLNACTYLATVMNKTTSPESLGRGRAYLKYMKENSYSSKDFKVPSLDDFNREIEYKPGKADPPYYPDLKSVAEALKKEEPQYKFESFFDIANSTLDSSDAEIGKVLMDRTDTDGTKAVAILKQQSLQDIATKPFNVWIFGGPNGGIGGVFLKDRARAIEMSMVERYKAEPNADINIAEIICALAYKQTEAGDCDAACRLKNYLATYHLPKTDIFDKMLAKHADCLANCQPAANPPTPQSPIP